MIADIIEAWNEAEELNCSLRELNDKDLIDCREALINRSQIIPLAAVKQEGIVALLLWQKLDSLLYVNPGGITLTSSKQLEISM